MSTPIVDDTRPDARLADVPTTSTILGGVSRSELYEMFARGDLETVKIGRRRMVLVSSIDAYIDRLRIEEAADNG
jgi:Helix-turn-helix domain